MGLPLPEPTVTVDIQQKSLGRILHDVFAQTGYKYEILADLGTTVFSLNVKNVPLSEALRTVLAEDKSDMPLVFSFTRDPTGTTGTFSINREFLEVGVINGETKLSATNARITRLLPKVFEMMGVKYRIEPDVPPILITLELRPDDWSQVLPQVILEGEKVEPTLDYSMDGETYVVFLEKTPIAGQSGSPARRVKLSVMNAPLRSVLEELFRESAWKYEVATGVPDVGITYNAVNEPELGALRAVLKLAAQQSGKQFTYREGKGLLYIEPGPLPGEIRVGARKEVRPDLVTLDVKKTLVKIVFDSIERQAGVKIHAPATLPNLPVDVKVTKVPAGDAIQAVIEALGIPNLQFRASGKDYTIVPGNKQ